jgi:uncharacterized protein (DUF2062 family)/trans-aconitate methyltransferase
MDVPVVTGRAARYLYKLRTEGQSRGRQAAAIGLGLFIGCTPFYGGHFWICMAAGWLLGLNRLKLYLAANISNPLVAPFLVFTEIQAGSLLRRGQAYPLTVEALRGLSPWGFAADLLIGSAAVGGLVGGAAALATWAAVGRRQLPAADERLVSAAAGRYLQAGIPAWEVANGKLRGDPVYLDVVRRVPLPAEGTILDLGCGRGLMLAVLAEEREQAERAPGWRLHGIEYRGRIVRIARRALGDAATIEQADLAGCELPPCRAAMLFDVLHLLPEDAQESLLERIEASMEPGGLLIIREADAAGGWRFAAGAIANRVIALLQGRWSRRFHFRTADGWADLLERFGFEVQADTRRATLPLVANVLLWARKA